VIKMAEETGKVQKKEAQVQEGVERTKSRKVYTPHVDIIERKEDIVLIADMPGVDEKSVDITLEKNMLTIYGATAPEVPEGHRPAVSEYGIGDYQRVFTLSDEVERNRIQASFKNGVLKLILPKAEAEKAKKIAVRAEA
jgi:HSP20 family protein